MTGLKIIDIHLDHSRFDPENSILFQSRDRSGRIMSLIDVVEASKKENRSRTLDIYETIVSSLEESAGHSEAQQLAVAMSLPSERSFTKSNVPTLISLLVGLDDVLESRRPACVTYVGRRRHVRDAIRVLCKAKDIKFVTTRRRADLNWRARLRKLSILRFVYFLAVRRREVFSKVKPLTKQPSVLFFGYQSNEDSYIPDVWVSRYWGNLPLDTATNGDVVELLNFKQTSPSVLFKSMHDHVSTSDDALTMRHFDEQLTIRILIESLSNWLRIRRYWKVQKTHLEENLARSILDWVWPIVEEDCQRSLHGDILLQNLIYSELIRKVLADLKPVRVGVFLMEGQGWEKALAYHWRKLGHGKLIGYAHSTIRFWDLRYFGRQGRFDPDRIALNGPLAQSTFAEGSRSQIAVEIVEATRYFHLSNGSHHVADQSTTRKSVLVAGGIGAELFDELVATVAGFSTAVSQAFSFVFREHPTRSSQNNPSNSPRHESPPNGRELLSETISAVIATADTSVSLEAFVSGLPVLVHLPLHDIDRSPVPDHPYVVRCSSSSLEAALSALPPPRAVDPSSTFLLDIGMPRWRHLLSSFPQIRCDQDQ